VIACATVPFANAQNHRDPRFANGDGIEKLEKSSLASEFAIMHPPAPTTEKPPLGLSIELFTTLHGIGTVVTGTLTGGQTAARDQKNCCVQPGNLHTRIRSIQSHGPRFGCRPNRGTRNSD